MFNIKIDKELLTYLSEGKLRLDELLVVMAFGLGKLELLKVLLNGRTGDQCTAFMQAAERKGLVRRLSMIENFDWDNYAMTEAGNVVYEDCLCNISERDIQAVEAQLVSNPPVCIQPTPAEDELGQTVREFLALWPEGVRNMNGDKIKSNPLDITKKMGQFIKKYKFDRQTIVSSTERYLARQRAQGYAYCNQAMYFIIKDGISKLASECENNDVESPNWDERMS